MPGAQTRLTCHVKNCIGISGFSFQHLDGFGGGQDKQFDLVARGFALDFPHYWQSATKPHRKRTLSEKGRSIVRNKKTSAKTADLKEVERGGQESVKNTRKRLIINEILVEATGVELFSVLTAVSY